MDVLRQAGGKVLERVGADERQALAERHLVALDHQALDGRQHDAERAAGVRGVLTAIAGQLETEEGRRILALTERDTKKKLKKQVPAQRRATRDAQPDAT